MGKGSRSNLRKIIKAARRKKGVRENNGRISRAIEHREPPEDPTVVMVTARVSHHGLTEVQARSPLAGTEHGRMFQRGILTATEHQAAERYIARRRAWERVVGGPRPAQMNLDGTPKGAAVFEPDPDREEAAREAWQRIQAAFQFRDALMSALNTVCVHNEPLPRSRHPQLITALGIIACIEGLK